MINSLSCFAAVLFNLMIYFIFGSLITGNLKGRRFSATLSVITGFFVYYLLFEVICLPLMVRFKPLHLLRNVWAIAIVIITIVSAVINHKKWVKCFFETVRFLKEHMVFAIVAAVILLSEGTIITHCYQFTLDAAYYVGTASTSLVTDMINIYNPYTGMWQDHFEMRYFFANYAINDAVMCSLTGLHPLVWTKTIMEWTVIVLVNMALYRLGRAIFRDDLEKTGLFMFFSALISFFYSTIYTAQEFFVTRTYEGKTVVGSFILPLIFLVYIKLLKDHKDRFLWCFLFLMSTGALVLSNTASMLFPAALFVFMIPLFFIKRDPFILVKSFIVTLPCIASILLYVLYVKGYFVIRTIY